MARHLDVDAFRAAREETVGDPPTVLLFGNKYTLPAKMPFAVIDALATDTADSFRAAVVALIGEDGLQKIIAAGASSNDMSDLLILAATDLYGAADPEGSSVSSVS